MTDSSWHPSVDDVLSLHEDIVSEYPDTPSGVRKRDDVEFALTYVEDGHVGAPPETVHERGFHLLRLLVANHPFVDANKRTALNTTAVFYRRNGHLFEYDDEIRTILKRLGTDEAAVDETATVDYLRSHTTAVDSAAGERPDSASTVDGEPADGRRPPISQVAAADRDANRDVYDALETE